MIVTLTGLALFGTAFFLAFSNGANDNFKGVATLFGSGTTDYRRALAWATATTLAGSLTAIVVSQGLIDAFSGKGLVPDDLTTQPGFLIAVGAGAAITVLAAALGGIPISTTHALVGALIGAGLVYAGGLDLQRLGQAYFLPLAVSPLIAIALTGFVYFSLHQVRLYLGIESRLCVCLQHGDEPVVMRNDGTMMLERTRMELSVNELENCRDRYAINGNTTAVGIDIQKSVDTMHYLSAGMVGFARGLNDTPKIAALLVGANIADIPVWLSVAGVAIAMALGGLTSARRVAATLSKKIVPMNHGQGFSANLVTALIVIFASKIGVPVSTTHVSVGGLFGLGAATGEGRWRVVGGILLAWLFTLPVAASFGAGLAVILDVF